MKSKRIILLWLLLIQLSELLSQEIPVQVQQQLENMLEAGEEENEDDAYWQQLEKLNRDPLNLNQADAEDLKSLRVLSELQVEYLLNYRSLFGQLISVYELQAVPGWHPALIRRLMPFITVTAAFSTNDNIINRFRNGSHTFLVRIAEVLQKSKGLQQSGTGYEGSPLKIFARYRYAYKNLLQFGWLGDKDAGENFMKGAQRHGFDFNSFHLFARKLGMIDALALGDFTVNMGQGLIHWQGLAFRKSGETMAVKRQSPVLRPYNSAGEFNFHRGLGITIRKRNVEATGFVSFRKLSANREVDTAFREVVSSIQTSGYHRTAGEIADKNSLNQFMAGANISYKRSGLSLGINAVHYLFSIPIAKRDEPYNLYSIKGDRWYNASIDYSYTFRNIHFFGEAAIDKGLHNAFINGCMISVDPALDISFVYRHLGNEYQSMYGNAFTENTLPANENGLYAGITLRPASAWKLDLYSDLYQFPWLKYLVDAPSYGKDALLQVTYTPDKKMELQMRLRNEYRLKNLVSNTTVTNQLSGISRTGCQVLLNYQMSRAFTVRSRLQLLWLKGQTRENGFSISVDGIYKPPMRPYSLSARAQFFETTGYNSRLYAFENDVPYSSAIPAMFGAGYRYYFVAQFKPFNGLTLGLRWAETIYILNTEIGSGLDVIAGNQKTEVKMQCIYSFN